jgi:hypothetical protein
MGEELRDRTGVARRARWAAALLRARENACTKLPLDDRRAIVAEELAAVKARLAESDEEALGRMMQRYKEDKAAAAVAGLKRPAECSRERKALRARAQNQLNERSVAVESPRASATCATSPHESRERTNPAERSPMRKALRPPPPCSDPAQSTATEGHEPMDGWHLVEAKSGRRYFVNSLTQESQWEVPVQGAASSAWEACDENRSQPSLAALRWHHAIDAFILARRHRRIIAQLKNNQEVAP